MILFHTLGCDFIADTADDDGGCHAGFGMYGPQDGDGTPTITATEQITRTADAITAMTQTP